jgi:hypothetical protein
MDADSPIREIEALATDAGLSIRRLCKIADIAPSTWMRWKSGQHGPSWRKLKQVRERLVAELAKAA